MDDRSMDFLSDLISAPFICMGWIIVGAIAGSLARSLMRAQDQPFVADLILGIAGAFVGGLMAGILGLGPDGRFGRLGTGHRQSRDRHGGRGYTDRGTPRGDDLSHSPIEGVPAMLPPDHL
jgi:uncharacterized membrane protein YeaQ/YmgE (transglycosylase-associated protein family)